MNLMTKRMTLMVLGVAVLFGGLFGYQMFSAHMMKKYLASNANPPATVTAMPAAYEDWQLTLHAIGSLRAVQGVNISAEVAGQVVYVHVHSGQRVKKGDLMVELNHRDEDALLRSLSADARLAEISYKRDKAQLAASAISQATFDATSAKFVRSKAVVEQQKALISKKRISAPFAGRIGIVAVNPGQYLSPADVITSLQNTNALFVDFYLPQKDVGMIKTGQNLRISSDAWPDRMFPGEISAMNVAVDAKTRNVRIEGRMTNPDGLLFPGMFISLEVDHGQKQRYLTLPQTAISYNAYGATVFIAKAGKAGEGGKGKPRLVAQQEFVKTGPTRGDQVAILSGIREGDRIVTSGQMKLKNGTPLMIDNSILPANAPAPAPQEH